MAKFKTTYKVPPKSNEITRIAIVIDESGSMGHLRSEVVSAFNRQLEDIKRESARTGKLVRGTSVLVVKPVANLQPGEAVNSCLSKFR